MHERIQIRATKFIHNDYTSETTSYRNKLSTIDDNS